MATRRPIYRKQEKRSTSRIGLLFCLLLAGGVMLVPVGGDFVHAGKMKLRDMALNSGLIDETEAQAAAPQPVRLESVPTTRDSATRPR